MQVYWAECVSQHGFIAVLKADGRILFIIHINNIIMYPSAWFDFNLFTLHDLTGTYDFSLVANTSWLFQIAKN